ncbi:hypothetical protein N7517_011410 [Penicillium concentricum]|uniref:Uncharacterized protein n=1 Tax=Penicillium concentricum TaxID=293559 RepID=A0A9W9UW03_9EURO|nr:uncharacterized protein N7517_011410 [Penicillium concentricum]KAJ5356801.1 hypothetical protein N7517_011410 [Penicillium concentricum]
MKTTGAIFLLASCLPAVLAEKCSAIGWQHQTTIKGGTLGNYGVTLYRGDKEIGKSKNCRKCPGVCSDLTWVEGEGLEAKFGWAASCNINHFTECHGSYATQTHIDGEKPSKDGNAYGISVGVSSQCKIEFDC